MKINLPDRVNREIKQFAKKSDISKIVIFGSRARGDYTERSDIDIAVVGERFDEFYFDIKENLHSLLLVDVINYEVASNELKKEIERDGVVIYEKT